MLPTSLDWLALYYPEAHVKLTAMYDYTIAQGFRVADWEVQFNQLFSAINAWRGHDISSTLTSLISSAYGFVLVGYQFGYTSVFSQFTARYIYSCNDIFYTLLARADSYYDDLVETPILSGIYISNKIQQDISVINAYAATESNRVQAAISAAQAQNQSHINKVLYDTPQPQVVTPVSREDVRDIVFLNLGYKTIYSTLNVGGLVPPVGLP